MTKRKLSREELSALPPDQLIELMQIAEQRIVQKRKVQDYVPNSVQAKVHASPAFIRCLFSGNGVGKTTACIKEAIWTSTGTHPYRDTARLPNIVIIVLDDASKADTVYMANIRKRNWYDISKLRTFKDGRAHTQRVVFPNGSEWHFMTHDMDNEKWESIECACVIFDEPPPRLIYIALLRGMREKDMKPWIMFAGTPLGRNAPWMYKEIYKPWKFGEDPEIECFFGSTHANLHNLDPEVIERWKRRYSEKELRTRLEGSFEFLSGRIFDNFDREVHIEKDFPFPSNWRCILAVDPHLRKPHVAIVMGVDPDGELWVVREIHTKLAGKRAANYIIDQCEGLNVRTGICDNFGSIKMYGEEERKSFIEIFNEEARKRNRTRLQLKPTTRAQKRDDEWIEDMKDWLNLEEDFEGQPRPKFHVFASCVRTIEDFESYVWDEHTGRKADLTDEPKEDPLGTNQDFLMCVKYALSTKPEKIGSDKVYSRKMIQNKAQEYESRGLAKDWRKD